MLHLLLDENFDHDVLRAIKSRLPEADLVTVQEVGLTGADDPDLLAWAAEHRRILVTRDRKTMTKYAYERVKAGQFMAGVFSIPDHLRMRDTIEQLILLIACSEETEWENGVLHLPY
jgi:hypothetical protein